MPRIKPLGPYLALAVALAVTTALAVLVPGGSKPRQASPGDWFRPSSGGSVHLDQPVR